ncbi:uncharacterized protein LOC125053331 [Pieris napi]|uniref:uncharacterized protein LOC125053331 n=1 Tax=Pieris napi TaxID=78633 RepID=UPI001FBA49DA|nr:uncharacterized protein LOC125053331 [Pieris napi]
MRAFTGLRKNIFCLIQKKQYCSKTRFCYPHMNELPVPCGAWEPWYREKQAVYNKYLFAGIVWWLFSFGLAIYTESIYLNWGPPAQPGPPSDMVEECDDSDS